MNLRIDVHQTQFALVVIDICEQATLRPGQVKACSEIQAFVDQKQKKPATAFAVRALLPYTQLAALAVGVK